MIIKKLTASFGKLNGDTLELSDGLNIIRAPNESGKSTWCAFIRAMLYGINTSERDKQGFLSDKNKYMPWSGIPMEGRMEIVHDGKPMTISRTSTSAGPMKNFTAVYTDSADRVAGITGTNAGEILTGASDKVFERTAFIRQAGIRVSQNGELEKRIAALVSSGSEQRPYSEADGDIRQWMRKLRYNKSGTLPKLEEERKELADKYASLERKTDQLAQMRESVNRAAEVRDKLASEIELHKKIEKRNMLRSLSEAKLREMRAESEIREISEKISVGGHIPTKDEIADIRVKCSTMDSLNLLYMRSVDERDNAKALLKEAKDRYNNTEFIAKFPSEEMATIKASFISGYKIPEPTPPPEPPKTLKYTLQISLCIIFALIGCIFGTAGFTFAAAIRDYAPAGFGLSALCLVLMMLFLGKRAKSKAEAESFVPIKPADPLEEYYAVFGEMTLDELKAVADDYLDARNAYKDAFSSYTAIEKTLENAEESVKAAENLVVSSSSTVLREVPDPYSVLPELVSVEDGIEKLAQAEFDKKSVHDIIETLSKTLPNNVEVTEGELLPIPDHTYEAATAQYAALTREYESLIPAYNMAYGELKAIGDPMVIKSRISEIDEEIERQTGVYESLEMARNALSESNTELQTRFSPVISKTAGKYMSALTGGRYSDLTFDKAFNAMARADDEVVSRNILSLSEGTADQIYLALRLAMSTLILSGDEPAPLILDDALVNFDNTRMGHAIELLRKMAGERQIIMFTCHDRELQYASDYPDVNTLIFKDE